ncbi:MAG: efflux RND transporter periplasmic adaptor subunit [Acidobacteria bacterium]|nr:efflux RND transporter periplasmic adaptor subunit [Acidobacteriota bacterium]
MRNLVLPVSVLALVGLCGCGRQQPMVERRETGPIEVQVAPVAARQIQRIVESVGTLFPFDEVVVSAEIEGPVEKVDVDLGDAVQQGQVLARISEEEQRYLLVQTEAQLRQALERLGLKSENEKVRDIRQAPEVRRAEADLFEAEQRFKRVRELVDQGVGSRQDLDQSEARFKALRAAYDTSLIQTRNLIQEVERYRAVLDLQRKKLRDTTVRAPFSAFVKERMVTAGQYVRPNTPLFALVKIDPIRLRAEVPERMSPWVKVGQTAEVWVEAYLDRTFLGKIWRISPTVDASKRTFVVEALVQNPEGELKPGSYARVRVKTARYDEVKLVPVRAVNYVLGSNKVYVVREHKVEAREVKLGDRFGQDVEILEGVKEGEQVATTQVARLDTGSRVRLAGN